MRIESLELFCIKMPMVGEFTTSFGTTQEREILLVKASVGGASGWGESGADGVPMYSYATARTGWHIIEDFVAPVVLEEEWPEEGFAVAYAEKFSSWRWHPMARCAVEEALWVLEAQRGEVSLQSLYADGRSMRQRISVGISLGIQDDFEVLADQIGASLEQGYQRIKLKIEPGRDVSVVEPVRERFGDIPLMVDANCGYRNDPDALGSLKALDGFNLLMIEQPLAEGGDQDLEGYEPPVLLCADESCNTLGDLEYLATRYQMVNLKLDKTGGLTEALRMARRARDLGLELMIGNMLGTSLAMAPAFVIGLFCRYNDLDGPLLQQKDRENGMAYDGGTVSPPRPELWG